MGMQPITIVPRSLEPRQVNADQEPVFSVLVYNRTRASVEILPSTRLWAIDYEGAADRGFSALLESPIAVPARREAVLRFRPTRIDVPRINSGVFPVRLDFSIKTLGSERAWTEVSHENCIRIGGNAGIEPVESIGFLKPTDPNPAHIFRAAIRGK
jgi:hypothetical protein